MRLIAMPKCCHVLAAAERDVEKRCYPGGAFDPLGLAAKDEEQTFRLKTCEIKHARLAMVAFFGYAVQVCPRAPRSPPHAANSPSSPLSPASRPTCGRTGLPLLRRCVTLPPLFRETVCPAAPPVLFVKL